MAQNQKSTRNRLLAERYYQGNVTLQELGEEFSISKQRVQQLINQYDPSIIPEVLERHKLEAANRRESLRPISRIVLHETCGNVASYVHGNCRCDDCKKANRKRSEISKQRRVLKGQSDPTLIPHGVNGYTNWGCRCDICVNVNKAKCRQYRLMKEGYSNVDHVRPGF